MSEDTPNTNALAAKGEPGAPAAAKSAPAFKMPAAARAKAEAFAKANDVSAKLAPLNPQARHREDRTAKYASGADPKPTKHFEGRSSVPASANTSGMERAMGAQADRLHRPRAAKAPSKPSSPKRR